MGNSSDQPQSARSAQSTEIVWVDRSAEVIGAALEVHRILGPGLLESAYEACLVHELEQRGLRCERQKPLPIVYKGVRIDVGYRLDLVVEDDLIVELKSVERLDRVHLSQMLSYLKLAGKPLGLLINFNVPMLKQGIRRIANGLPE
jgi:GxxExxY protein